MTDKRVAVFLPSLEGGGAEKCMLELAKCLSRKGLDIHLVLARAEGTHLVDARETLDAVDLGGGTKPDSALRLIRYLQRARPNVLIAALEEANVAALVAKRVSGVDSRIVITTHTLLSKAVQSSPRVTSRLIIPVLRGLYPLADCLVAVSGAVAADLADITGLPLDSIRVIANPVVTPDLLTLSKASVSTSWFGPGAPPVISSVGSLLEYKGHDTLIKAVNIVRRERPVRLVILGEGPERARLAALCRKLALEQDVMMPGFVSNPYAWVARSAVFVLPSRWEGLGNALIEALALGVTSVATDCLGGPREILNNGEFGRLTPVGDPEAMAQNILKSLERPLDAVSLQQRADFFSVERSANGYMQLISALGTP